MNNNANEKMQELLREVKIVCNIYNLIFWLDKTEYKTPCTLPLEGTKDNAAEVNDLVEKILKNLNIEYSSRYELVSAQSGDLCWGFGYPLFTLTNITWNQHLKTYEFINEP